MKIEYIAFDGTRFDSKDQCNLYEKNKETEFIKTKRLVFWSASDDELNAENIGSTNFFYLDNEEEKSYIKSSVMFIKDQEVLDYIHSTYIKIKECGLYFWSGVNKWVSAKEIKKQCYDTLKQINELEIKWDNT